MEILLVIGTGLVNVLCFFVGAKVGQKVARGESIKMPNINPIDAVNNHQDKKRYRHEQSRMETLLENIDTYDGTGFGQKDIPR